MELVWHSAKEYIANKLFKSLEELESLIKKLLNEGGWLFPQLCGKCIIVIPQ
jgi:hypothetical protein